MFCKLKISKYFITFINDSSITKIFNILLAAWKTEKNIDKITFKYILGRHFKRRQTDASIIHCTLKLQVSEVR